MTDTSELRRLVLAGGRDLPWEIDDPATGYMRIMGQMDGDADDNGRSIITWPHIADIIDSGDYAMVADLIVAAVNSLPALLDEIDRLRAENARMREALKRLSVMPLGETCVDGRRKNVQPETLWLHRAVTDIACAALEADHG